MSRRTVSHCIVVAGGLLAASAAQAEPVIAPCDGANSPASLATVIEPWDEYSRTYANGAIRVVHVDTSGEPVCCSSHIAVLFPTAEDGPAYRECVVVSDGPDYRGFLDVRLAEAAASYDAARGLLISVPVERYDGVRGADPARSGRVRIRVNQATGTATLER